jgi:hypothetical protein
MSNIAFFSHVFAARPESHEQDGEKLSRLTARCGEQQRLAILLIGVSSLALSQEANLFGSCRSPAARSPPDQ